MQPFTALTRIIHWRWAPCIAPVVGSLAFITLAITFIPDELGANGDGEADSESSSSDESATEARSSEPRKTGTAARRPRRTPRSTPQAAPADPNVEGLFAAPTVELPPPLEEPPPPAAPEPAPAPTEIAVPDSPPAEAPE